MTTLTLMTYDVAGYLHLQTSASAAPRPSLANESSETRIRLQKCQMRGKQTLYTFYRLLCTIGNFPVAGTSAEYIWHVDGYGSMQYLYNVADYPKMPCISQQCGPGQGPRGRTNLALPQTSLTCHNKEATSCLLSVRPYQLVLATAAIITRRVLVFTVH